MTEESKNKIKGWTSTVVGVPIAIIVTIAVIGGGKLEVIDTLTDQVNYLTTESMNAQLSASIISTQLEDIKDDVCELKHDMKILISNGAMNQEFANIQEYKVPSYNNIAIKNDKL